MQTYQGTSLSEATISMEKDEYIAIQNDSRLVHQAIELIALKYPNNQAIVHNEEFITYHDLTQKSDQIASKIKTLGIKPNTFIAVCIERNISMFVAILGILKVGCAYVPIDPSDPGFRIHFVLKNSESSAIITDRRTLKQLQRYIPENYDEKNILILDEDGFYCEEEKQQKRSQIELAQQQNQLIYMIYTSGSTGQPKGVMVTHQNLLNYINWFLENFKFNSHETFDFSTSLSFDLSVTATLIPLVCGGKIIICDQDIKLDPYSYIQHLLSNQITYIKTTPSYFNLLMESPEFKKLTQLKWIILGGENVSKKQIKRWLLTHPTHHIVNEYGPTEATVATLAYVATSNNIDHFPKIVPIGRPAANTKIYIVNKQRKLCNQGSKGELCIAGKNISVGYWKQEQYTKNKLIVNPFDK